MKEKWKNIVVDGKVYEKYSVSNLGRVISHLKKNNGKILKPRKSRHRVSGHRVTLLFPKGFFNDYEYHRAPKEKLSRRDRGVHQLVMETFFPIDKNPPAPVSAKEWERTPESVKQIVRECIFINHKDHNPANNRLDNLEYVTPRQNSRKAVEHYKKRGETKKFI